MLNHNKITYTKCLDADGTDALVSSTFYDKTANCLHNFLVNGSVLNEMRNLGQTL